MDKWRTGTPTENGLYVLAYRYGNEPTVEYVVLEWDGIWKDTEIGWDAQKITDLAFMMITPYKEGQHGALV